MKKIVIAAAGRTPIGSFMGRLSSTPAPRLGSIVIRGLLNKINLDPSLVDEIFMGNVLQAGLGQAPARQAALGAGIPKKVPCTTVNKVCASGMKSITLGAQAIAVGDAEIVIAGGMENMSLTPHYLPASRNGKKFGNITMIDGLAFDGLTDPYTRELMGAFADETAKKYNFSREEQDQFAIESYRRAAEAWKKGKFKHEIIAVEIPVRKGEPVIFDEDEEYQKVDFEKIPVLRPSFSKEGTVTAANASTLNDGAAAVILMSEEKAKELGLTPLASILAYADAAHEPEWFTTAPAKAVPRALSKAGISIDEVDYFELNEAFSVVGLVNIKLLSLDKNKVNINGGAVSLGHPLGCSGARIVVTLLNVLKQNHGKTGIASICNGGGGASALVIENWL